MLETCLRAVGESRGGADIVSVCFDEEVTHDHRELAGRFPWAEFYRSKPHSNGPYVSRERLVRSSPTPIILFQDSDDAPTVSRTGVLIPELLEFGADLIGSHELHVNEVWRKLWLSGIRWTPRRRSPQLMGTRFCCQPPRDEGTQ